MSPQSAELHYDLGKLFSINDDWPRAKHELEEALRIDPSYVEAWDALGFAAESLGDDAGAIADYQKAIHLNESRKGRFTSAQVNLSAFYNRTEQPDKALEYAKAALELNPRNDRAWFQQAKAYEKLGRLDAAVDSAKHATELNARASSYYYVLAMLYRRIGKTSESREALAQFTKLDQESSEIDKKRRDLDLREIVTGKEQRGRLGASVHNNCAQNPLSRRTFLQALSRSTCLLPLIPFAERLWAGGRAPGAPGTGVIFRDVSVQAGLAGAKNVSGSATSKQFLLEEMGCGVALFDYDNDGWLDIFLVNGTTFESGHAAKTH